MARRALVWSFVAAMSFLSTAHAVIISGSTSGGTATAAGGVFQKRTPPIGSVGNDNFQSHNLFGFDEDQNIVIGSALAVDVGAALPIGTEVASHYVFFDPIQIETMVGSVTFDARVLAIMTSTANLAASDFLANVSATYLNPSLRGLETSASQSGCPGTFNDSVTIDPTDNHRILVNLCASSPGDYVRVLTEHSPRAEAPLPATLFLVGLGALCIPVVRARKA